MDKNSLFKYHYSAANNEEVESIRQKYLPHAVNKLILLRKLDRKVQTAGMIEALILGIIGFLIFCVGVCFFVEILTGEIWISITLFAIGLAFMSSAYPLFRRIARKTKERLVPKIIELTDEIMK